MRFQTGLALLVVLLGATPAAAAPATPAATPTATPAAGAQMSPATSVLAAFATVAPRSVAHSQLVARAVISAARTCPSLKVTVAGRVRSVPMSVRAPAADVARNFALIRVCQAPMPKGATGATIAGTRIPAAIPARTDRIAVLGDTGCRILKDTQDCLNPADWPLESISARIAAAKPDLIVHVGDYVYREEKCPDRRDCGESPGPIPHTGIRDRAAVWLLDVLRPMQALFAAAPILFLRGNHEDCADAGNGFFLLLDPRPGSVTACAPVRSHGVRTVPERQLPPWAVTVTVSSGRTLRLVAVDSAYGWDNAVSPYAATQRRAYTRARSLAKARSVDEAILLVHRPIFGVTTTRFADTDDPEWTPWVSADQMAASRGLLSHYSLILSGHEHLAQVTKIQGQPLQAIVGNGGTWLNPRRGYAKPTVPPLVTASGEDMIEGPRLARPSTLWTKVAFGFSLLTPGRSAGRWTIDMRTADGRDSMQRCSVRALSLVRCAE